MPKKKDVPFIKGLWPNTRPTFTYRCRCHQLHQVAFDTGTVWNNSPRLERDEKTSGTSSCDSRFFTHHCLAPVDDRILHPAPPEKSMKPASNSKILSTYQLVFGPPNVCSPKTTLSSKSPSCSDASCLETTAQPNSDCSAATIVPVQRNARS